MHQQTSEVFVHKYESSFDWEIKNIDPAIMSWNAENFFQSNDIGFVATLTTWLVSSLIINKSSFTIYFL